ncbi:MAG: DCC1-like thiol-disulfide oxidoreductase family protein [Alphaproteobacteria bacterium]
MARQTIPILLFDGDCVLCSRWVRFILTWERSPEIRFVAAQSAAGQAFLSEHGLPLSDWTTNYFLEPGPAGPVLHEKSGAALAVLRRMRAPVRWLAALEILPRPARDWFYDRVARNRYAWFGRLDRCALPPPEVRARFL